MAETNLVPARPDEPVHDLGDAGDALVAHGLLWALNEFVLHGQGYELVVLPGRRLGLKGDGSVLRNWAHVPAVSVDAAMRRLRQALLEGQANNKRVRQPVRSPGFRTIGPSTLAGETSG